MTIRERTEEIEYQILSPLAQKSREAKRVKDEERCPYRTEFQRDRDRILHSKAFRRLKHKTQVYILSGDHYRTRMTHSLEVAQISRTIARGLRLNEDLTEAIALGHDVGHTPFGHSGEAALSSLIGHFAHNEQSVRVLDYIERGGEGLNLTEEVKDGILNHSGNRRAKTLEGRIVHLADRIAYLCHDFDDSIRAGLLKTESLPGIVSERLGTTHSNMITQMVSDVIINSQDKDDIVLSDEIGEAMTTFRTFMFTNIYHSDALAVERKQAIYVLKELYSHFFEHMEELPDDFLFREGKWGKEQTIVDYVAGLTDGFAVKLFHKIFIPPVGEFTI